MNDDEKIVTLESYYEPMLAEIIRGRLEAEGIPSFIADDPIYKSVLGGVKLKVFERDLAKCREILAEENTGDLPLE